MESEITPMKKIGSVALFVIAGLIILVSIAAPLIPGWEKIKGSDIDHMRVPFVVVGLTAALIGVSLRMKKPEVVVVSADEDDEE